MGETRRCSTEPRLILVSFKICSKLSLNTLDNHFIVCHKGSVSLTSKKLSCGCREIRKQPTIMCSDDHINLLGTRTEHQNTNFLNSPARERFVFVFICNPTSRNQHCLIERFVTFCVLHPAYSSSNVLDRFGGIPIVNSDKYQCKQF